MDKINIKYATYANALPPQPVKLKKPGWAGTADKMVDGSEPQPWHCLPFVEGSTYGLELVYQYETECHVVNDNGNVYFDFDYMKEPGGVLTGGEFITFFPKERTKFYLFNTRIDLVPPAGHVIRTEPHPRFFSDETGTVPVAICGHLQNEWWPRKLFVVFKVPPPGQRHIFRKGEPYAQILVVPHRAPYETEPMPADEEQRRRALETQIDAAKPEIAENIWHNPVGNAFSDYYKVLARAFSKDGLEGVEQVVRLAVERQQSALPKDKPLSELLTLGRQKINEAKYDEARQLYQHVLSREPNSAEALSHLGICAVCMGSPAVGLKMMTQAVNLQPNHPPYLNNLGELLRMIGKLPEAENAFRQSLRLNPNDPTLLSTLGQTLAQQGRTAEGLEACQTALRMDPNLPTVHYRMGLIYAQERRAAEARAAYEAALAIDPNYEPAKASLKQLPAEVGR